QTCAIEDIEFTPSNQLRAWALAQSSLDGSVAFALSKTVQAQVQVDAGHTHGALWTDVTGNLNSVFSVLNTQATTIAPDPINASVAYLGLSGFSADTGVGHIYKTQNIGATWIEADGWTNNGLTPGTSPLPDVPVLKILVDRTDSSAVCAGG